MYAVAIYILYYIREGARDTPGTLMPRPRLTFREMSEPDTDTDEFQSAAEEEEVEGECSGSAPGVTGSPLAARLEQMPPLSGEDATLGQETRTGVQSNGTRTPCEPASDVKEGGSLGGRSGDDDGDGGGVGMAGESVTDAGVEVEGDNVSGLDNRYVSEDVVVKGKEVELTEEQAKVGGAPGTPLLCNYRKIAVLTPSFWSSLLLGVEGASGQTEGGRE